MPVTYADVMMPGVTPDDRDLGVIEGDQFCDCGYNLHRQRVTRDERLGFAVVRCPECGAFHPAGHGSTATRQWLRRLAAVLLLNWLLLLTGVGLTVAGTAYGLTLGFVHNTSFEARYDPDTGRTFDPRVDTTQTRWLADGAAGRVRERFDRGENVLIDLATRDVADVGTTRAWNYGQARLISPGRLPEGHPERRGMFGNAWAYGLPFAGTGTVLGVLQSLTLWHLAGIRKALPALAVVGLVCVFVTIHVVSWGVYYGGVVGLIGVAMLCVSGAMFAGWLTAAWLGRRLARPVVMLLVPPGAWPALAPLWTADGLAVPTVSMRPR